MPHINVTSSSAQNWMTLTMLFGFATMIFWMVVGWRAMRAHERIADAAEQALMQRQQDPGGPTSGA